MPKSQSKKVELEMLKWWWLLKIPGAQTKHEFWFVLVEKSKNLFLQGSTLVRVLFNYFIFLEQKDMKSSLCWKKLTSNRALPLLIYNFALLTGLKGILDDHTRHSRTQNKICYQTEELINQNNKVGPCFFLHWES